MIDCLSLNDMRAVSANFVCSLVYRVSSMLSEVMSGVKKLQKLVKKYKKILMRLFCQLQILNLKILLV